MILSRQSHPWRPRWFSSLALTCLLSPATTACSQQIGQVFHEVSNAVVIVRTVEQAVPEFPNQQAASIGGLGSGVLISEDGKIMTAAHVVQTAEQVEVEFRNGQKIPAKVIAAQPAADVALLELQGAIPSGVTPVKLGDSNSSQVGDQVFVVGAPLGISYTLTVGHLSGRRIKHLFYDTMMPAEFFQTDAAINQGNSGGPMFNLKGEVIGIVSHMITRSGGSEGLGFATTSNMARRLLLDSPSMWSGMESLPIPVEISGAFNIPPPGHGLLVQKVARGSPAARLGLQGGNLKATILEQDMFLGGDIIVAAMGIPVGSAEGYTRISETITRTKRGEKIWVDILRGGQIQTLTMAKP